MTGTGEEWIGDGLHDIEGTDAVLWTPGVDYVAGWREARETADRLNRALLGVGFELSAVRAVASTDDRGRGVVRLAGRPDAVDRLAALLESVA
ncbi:hypothetical protein GTY75_09545 [Streptomyces sp. SID8381]|uniref:hypothetical protein n=1 Tax=unclassified Streptomyces TaxID=2593676 RepID=UPI00036E040B|nr:hypothetical protein [Streptomyces sp. Amel2xE9]MYX26909.1 hypothetical protein [Streptomyces sp. SID8381]